MENNGEVMEGGGREGDYGGRGGRSGIGDWRDGGSEGGYGRMLLPLPTHMVGRLDGRIEREIDGGREEDR